MSGCGLAQVDLTVARPELDDAAFVSYFEGKIKETIDEYELLSGSKKIAVAVSGGKDSTAILSVLLDMGYPVEAVTVDAKIGCYTETNLANLRKFCGDKGVVLHEISFRDEFGSSLCYLQSVLKSKGVDLKSCTTCGVLRRTLLNRKVREIEADVLVMGHNLDDEVQAFMMNMFKNTLSLAARSGPKTGRTNIEGLVPRVKPLYFLSNSEIIRYSKIKEFPVYFGECPCSTEGQRSHTKHWLNALEEEYPGAKEKAISYFMSHREDIRGLVGSEGQPNRCVQCSEPSSGDLCKSCQILNTLKMPAEN